MAGIDMHSPPSESSNCRLCVDLYFIACAWQKLAGARWCTAWNDCSAPFDHELVRLARKMRRLQRELSCMKLGQHHVKNSLAQDLHCLASEKYQQRSRAWHVRRRDSLSSPGASGHTQCNRQLAGGTLHQVLQQLRHWQEVKADPSQPRITSPSAHQPDESRGHGTVHSSASHCVHASHSENVTPAR